MIKYKILGIYSFADNLKLVKLNDPVILKKNTMNIKSKNAIAVYSKDNKKLGYLPVETEHNNNAYKISKLELNQDYPILEICRNYELNNNINNIEHPIFKDLKYSLTIIKTEEKMIEHLYRELIRKKIKVKKIAITYQDENYINVVIETNKGISTYYTVTRKFFNDNIHRYEELYEFKLIDTIFFKDLQIHRIEKYYEINYTNINEVNESCNYNNIEQIHEKLIIKKEIDWDKYIRFLITNNKIYFNSNIHDYIQNPEEITKFINKFSNIRLGSFLYNHELQLYGYTDLENDEYIFEINKHRPIHLLTKKKIILYVPKDGIIY